MTNKSYTVDGYGMVRHILLDLIDNDVVLILDQTALKSILSHITLPAATISLHSQTVRIRMPYRMAALVFENRIGRQLSFEYRIGAAPIRH